MVGFPPVCQTYLTCTCTERRGPLYEERLLRGFEPTCAYVDSLPVDWRTADLRGPAASSCRLCMLKRIAVHLREPTTNAPPALLPLLAKFSAQPRAPPEPPPPTPPPSTPPPSTPPPPPADMEDNAETSPVLGDDEPEESQPSAEPEHGTGPMVIEDPFGFHVFKVQPASVAAAIDSPRRRGRRRPLLAEPPRALACPGWTPTPFRLFGATCDCADTTNPFVVGQPLFVHRPPVLQPEAVRAASAHLLEQKNT
eukprot:TRINITY_DN2383_c0_g1_i11.p1 TRINITY_DN2383_c0_g1~~TRINITY_DN2383_c0_g1_i11.p1  ORF type:complete len:253 (-),score=33.18 TRINITY_DN2383_c0_g1_i11:14-772(-)